MIVNRMPHSFDGRTLVSIATYNECKNIQALVTEILDRLPQADVLVVDDNSPDGTGDLMDQMAARNPRVRVMHRAGKLGLGTAVLDAFRYAIKEGYECILTLDGDFSHPPRYLTDVLSGMDRYDVMIGSRYVSGGSIVGWNWVRKFMSGGINWYSRWLLGIKARDCSGGFRAYRTATLQQMDFRDVRSKGYSFMEEILYRCQRVGGRIGETPIVFENRKLGKSKINPQEAIKALWILGVLAASRLAPGSRTSAVGVTPSTRKNP